MPAKSQATRVVAQPTMAEFLLDRYEARKKEVRLNERRYFSQNDYAQREIGIVPQTFSRYLNGDVNMTMDQAVLLIKFYGTAVLDHFAYGSESSLSRQDAELIALAAEDEDIGRALMALAQMEPEQRKAAAKIILHYAEGGEIGNLNLSAV